ncbi:MAG: alpha/beta fold hydrolase [Candidatus Sericytochromatia bacterium]|nr:alpha/beta fold hydrolase [Candidatus Sericytochromatia bacterium]
MRRQVKNSLIAGFSLLAALAGLFLSGPRIDLSFTPELRELPADAALLPAYLAAREARYPDLVPGTENQIVWAGAPGQRTEYCLLYFPGFSATRQELQPVPQKVAEALGANVLYTRFRGHGRSGEAMLEGSVSHWLNDAQEAIDIGRMLGDKILIMGNSTGASLATLIAADRASEIHALLLLSPNYGLKDPMAVMMTWPWGKQLAQLVIGPERVWQPESEAEARYWTWQYPTAALLPMMGVVQRVQALDFAQLQTPVQMIYSPRDQVIHPLKVEAAYARWGASYKDVWAYTGSSASAQHVLAGDIRAPESTEPVVERMLRFIADLP